MRVRIAMLLSLVKSKENYCSRIGVMMIMVLRHPEKNSLSLEYPFALLLPNGLALVGKKSVKPVFISNLPYRLNDVVFHSSHSALVQWPCLRISSQTVTLAMCWSILLDWSSIWALKWSTTALKVLAVPNSSALSPINLSSSLGLILPPVEPLKTPKFVTFSLLKTPPVQSFCVCFRGAFSAFSAAVPK